MIPVQKQEEREVTELEVALHRARALLGEKEIRLRHIERALRRLADTHPPPLIQVPLTNLLQPCSVRHKVLFRSLCWYIFLRFVFVSNDFQPNFVLSGLIFAASFFADRLLFIASDFFIAVLLPLDLLV